MREILFRGKRIDNGEWVYGDLLQDRVLNECYIRYLPKNNWEAFELEEVDPETVGQDTGLKDKNGKKIYEGDIVEDNDGFKDIIEWDRIGFDGECGLTGFTFKNDCAWTKEDDFTECARNVNLKELKVVGNIYDNSEILKESKNGKEF